MFPKKQKWCLISHIYFLSGMSISTLSTISIFIYTFVFDNRQGNIIHLILILLTFIGVIMAYNAERYNKMYYLKFHAKFLRLLALGERNGFNEGVPNNDYNEFSININDILNSKKEINIYEEEKGIFYLKDDDALIKFDMRYWIRKTFYIYEYLMTLLQLEMVNKNRLAPSNMKRKIEGKFTSNHCVIFHYKSKNKKKYLLTKDQYTYPSFKFKWRISKKLKFIDTKKANIKDFYNFNK